MWSSQINAEQLLMCQSVQIFMLILFAELNWVTIFTHYLASSPWYVQNSSVLFFWWSYIKLQHAVTALKHNVEVLNVYL